MDRIAAGLILYLLFDELLSVGFNAYIDRLALLKFCRADVGAGALDSPLICCLWNNILLDLPHNHEIVQN